MTQEKELLLAKLEELQARFDEIERQIADPQVTATPAKLIALSKEQGKLKKIVSKYNQYKRALRDLKDADDIFKNPKTDDDFKTLAKQEMQQLEEKQNLLLEEIKNTLVAGEDGTIDAVIMEIRAGTGGDEAALFARDLYEMYTKYAEGRKWKVELLDFSPTETGGFREIIFGIKGPDVWSELGYEGGGHRVQRIPQTESQGRIHTSAATVAVLPEPQALDIQIEDKDIIEHVSRSGGPGGQNVNKVSSAIRLEHIPTGITVNMRDEKSQHKNRAKAHRILRSRIYEYHEGQKRAERASQRKTMIGSGDRSEKIRTYNFPQNRLTDHRINLSLYNLDEIIAGDMTKLIEALKNHDRQQRLKNLRLTD